MTRLKEQSAEAGWAWCAGGNRPRIREAARETRHSAQAQAVAGSALDGGYLLRAG